MGKVLIVEDDADTRRALDVRLRAAGYETLLASDGVSAVQVAQKERPSAILLDLGLPGGDGFTVLERLKRTTTLEHVPIVVVSARDPAASRERALSAGAAAFLPKPVDNENLLTTLAHLVPRQAETPRIKKNPKILVIEDDRDTRMGLTLRLQSSGYEVATAADAVSATTVAQKEKPDLILLDLGLPGGDGLVLVQRFKANTALAALPIVVLSARDPEVHRERALKAGVTAFLEKPADNETLLGAIREALGQTTPS